MLPQKKEFLPDQSVCSCKDLHFMAGYGVANRRFFEG